MTLPRLREAIRHALTPAAAEWLAAAVAEVTTVARTIHTVFPRVGRRCGRDPLGAYDPQWTIDDGARVLLLAASPAVTEELSVLYRHGDVAEKRAILRGLPYLKIGGAGLPLITDALRGNDPRLVVAALGEYGASWLDDLSYRQGVLKCVFMGIPLREVSGLTHRADEELMRMMRSFAAERAAAGRPVPADLLTFVPDSHRQD
ncbi:EboA domain-containing protein [Amycolatopsis samaneae]|uniref:EboA domain-containing protein n=1 Tax=Amycolatopsis samaneae TaxID=664691 RepID=A0ABW5GP12_9PSEU